MRWQANLIKIRAMGRLIYERDGHKYVLGRRNPAHGVLCTNVSGYQSEKEIGRVYPMNRHISGHGNYNHVREVVASSDPSLGLPPVDEMKMYAISLNFRVESIGISKVTEEIMDRWSDEDRFHTLEEAREGLKKLIRSQTRFDCHPLIDEVDTLKCETVDKRRLSGGYYSHNDEYLDRKVYF